MPKRIVISGLGVVSAAGVGLEAFWTGLTTATAPGLRASGADLAAMGVHVVGACEGVSGARYLQNERHVRVLNRGFELLVAAGALAAADAGFGATRVPPPRLGIVIGIGPIEQHTSDLLVAIRDSVVDGQPDLARFAEAARSLHPLRRLRLLPNVGPAILSIEHQAMGPCLTLVSGHATGLQAVAMAVAMIRDGRVDAVLCGGVDAQLTPLGVRVFAERCPISPSGNPLAACRPFDRSRDGVTPGEGAGILVIESEESARGRGAHAYAEVTACVSAGPTEGGCAESMGRAVVSLGEHPPDLLIAHGEGGVRSDRLEATAIARIAPRTVTSIQPSTGHTMSACGAVNLVAACLVLAHDRVPPIRSLAAPEFPLPFPCDDARARVDSVLVNALEPDQAATSALVTRL